MAKRNRQKQNMEPNKYREVEVGAMGSLPLVVEAGAAGSLPLEVEAGAAGILPLAVEAGAAGSLLLSLETGAGLTRPLELWMLALPSTPAPPLGHWRRRITPLELWMLSLPPSGMPDARPPPFWMPDARAPPTPGPCPCQPLCSFPLHARSTGNMHTTPHHPTQRCSTPPSASSLTSSFLALELVRAASFFC
ncbi:UNVERIFIED_CONTAM: hypothetical protein FKN15_058893 [Acipenser sinensis]